MLLTEWMQLPSEQRKAHIDLSTPCQILPSKRQWVHHLNKMLEAAGITRDVPNLINAKIHRIHECKHNSACADGICGNPLHWWIGTMSENVMSLSPEKRAAGGKACSGRAMTWGNKISASRRGNGKKEIYPRFISTIDGYLSTSGPLSTRHRHKGWPKDAKLLVPAYDVAAYETLTPLQRMMAMEMSFA